MSRSPPVAWGSVGLRHLLHVAQRATRAAPPSMLSTSSHACAGCLDRVSRGAELTQQPFFQAAVLLPSELYEYCSKAVSFISASFQGAPNLLHIHFHLAIPLNYLNSPSRKQSPSIIAPSSVARVEFGDLQIHSTSSSHSCRAAGFLRLPSLLPSSLAPGTFTEVSATKRQSQGRAEQLFTGVLNVEDLPHMILIIFMTLLGDFPTELCAEPDVPALQLY